MKIMQIVVIFLSLFVMLGGLALPLYWTAIQPYIVNIPAYAEGFMRNITTLIETAKGII